MFKWLIYSLVIFFWLMTSCVEFNFITTYNNISRWKLKSYATLISVIFGLWVKIWLRKLSLEKRPKSNPTSLVNLLRFDDALNIRFLISYYRSITLFTKGTKREETNRCRSFFFISSFFFIWISQIRWYENFTMIWV